MSYDSLEHYKRLADAYEGNWADRPQYVTWMAERIASWLDLVPGARVADVGAGTGLFISKLAEMSDEKVPVLCIDPSQPMLDQLPADPRLAPVCATAEQVAGGEATLPYDELDAVVFKESIHHVKDIPGTLRGLATRLAPGGRILIVTLPQRLAYPLFDAALDRFAREQPDPEMIAASLRDAKLMVDTAVEDFVVTIDREHWIGLVQSQWMSVLSTFTPGELAAGIEEIRARHPAPQITYADRFAFIRGIRT